MGRLKVLHVDLRFGFITHIRPSPYAIPQKCHSRVRWFTLSLHLLRLLHIKFKPICLFTVFDISSNYGRYNHVAGRQKHIGY